MTLIELIISLAILSLIMLAFSQVLKSSQAVVNGSEGLMQSSSAAAAITNQLRDDLACQTGEGFLAIIAPADGDSVDTTSGLPISRPGVIFPSIQPTVSRYESTVRANAALVCYTALEDLTPGHRNRPMLARRTWVLSNAPTTALDVLDPLVTGSGLTLANLNTRSTVFWNFMKPNLLTMIRTLGGINTNPPLGSVSTTPLWEVMSDDLRSMSVAWLEEPNPATGIATYQWREFTARWVVPQRTGDPPPHWELTVGNPKDALWTSNTYGSGTTEFAYNGQYIALWNQNTASDQWPVAVRVRFELGMAGAGTSDAAREGKVQSGETYEVICPVRRPLR